MHPVHCPLPSAQHQQHPTGAAVRAGHLLRWVAPSCVFRRENPGFGGWGWGWGTSLGTTYNNLIADLLLTRRAPCHLPPATSTTSAWACRVGQRPKTWGSRVSPLALVWCTSHTAHHTSRHVAVRLWSIGRWGKCVVRCCCCAALVSRPCR
jgi:hypothetical protein